MDIYMTGGYSNGSHPEPDFDDDLEDLLEPEPEPVLQPFHPPQPPKPPTRTLSAEEAERMRVKMAPIPGSDLDPSLEVRPDPWFDPATLIELPFEIYDRKASKLRVISRAFTPSSLVILAKQVMDHLSGVRSPVTATELHSFLTGPVEGAGVGIPFTCIYGRAHDPRSNDFVNDLEGCLDAHIVDHGRARRDAGSPWYLAHRPYVFMLIERGKTPSSGLWYLGSSDPASHPEQWR